MRIIETDRLYLREFALQDADFLFTLNNDEEVLKFTGDSAFIDESEAITFLNNYNDYEKNGFGRWVVVKKDTDEAIGWNGIKLNEENLIDIGFRFYRKEWNKGYATESSLGVLDYSFNKVGCDKIIGRASINNIPSIRVLEKIKMNFWKQGNVEGLDESLYYTITKNQYSNLFPTS